MALECGIQARFSWNFACASLPSQRTFPAQLGPGTKIPNSPPEFLWSTWNSSPLLGGAGHSPISMEFIPTLPLCAGPGRQRNILDFFGIPEKRRVGAAGMRSCGIKEEPLDPFFPGSGDSFRSAGDTGSNSSLCLDHQDFVAAPGAHSRKRALPAAASDIPNPEQDPWGEPDRKIPELSRVKQEWEDLEVEPLPDAHYGLLGTRSWEVPQGTMGDLPAEILRNIFAFLPVPDLYQNLSLVCRFWREIIRDPLVRNALGLPRGISPALSASLCSFLALGSLDF